MKFIMYVLLFFCVFSARGATVFVTVPGTLDHAEGNSVGWPFTFSDLGITSRRYQQVYDATQFSALGQPGGYITHLLFREEDMFPRRVAGDFLENVQINLGITARAPDSLSSVFDENVGPIYNVAYGPSPLQVSTGGMGAPWTVIVLTQPFLYTPVAGNLLLDIRTTDVSPDPSAQRTLDAQGTLNDPISAVMANDVNATSGFLSTHGLVTRFHFEPVPEPGTWLLLGLGLLVMWPFLRRRK